MLVFMLISVKWPDDAPAVLAFVAGVGLLGGGWMMRASKEKYWIIRGIGLLIIIGVLLTALIFGFLVAISAISS